MTLQMGTATCSTSALVHFVDSIRTFPEVREVPKAEITSLICPQRRQVRPRKQRGQVRLDRCAFTVNGQDNLENCSMRVSRRR